MKTPRIALAMVLAIGPQIASAAEPVCLTPQEFTAVATYGLPSVIKGTSERCAASLPAGAFLRIKGTELSDRYAKQKAAAWPTAKSAFLKMSSTMNPQAAELIKGLPDTSLQPMADGLLEGMVSQRLPTERCGLLNRTLQLLSPLPSESTAELITLAVGIFARTGSGKIGAISLCSAS